MARFPFSSHIGRGLDRGAGGRGPARVGDRAPDITLTDVAGREGSLHDAHGDSPAPTVVIFHRHIH